MSDDFERELRDELARSVPEPPEDLGRAAAAKRAAHRFRRRRTGVMAVIAGAAAVTAVVAVPTIIGDLDEGGRGVTVPEETESATTTPPGEEGYQCPPPSESQPLVSPSIELPGGAERARICALGEVLWTPPEDALETRIDELVVEINAADPVPEDAVCTADVGPAFTMTFQYEDRRTYGIRGSLGGCNTMVVGGHERFGADELVDLYAELLAEQRAGREPPSSTGVEPVCPLPGESGLSEWRTILFTDKNLDLTEAVYCVYADIRPPPQVMLEEEQLVAINEDFAARATRQAPGTCRCPGPRIVIRGVDAWGDRHELVLDDDTHFEYQGYYWRPSADVQDMLDSLFD
jgi:hypothetical protein